MIQGTGKDRVHRDGGVGVLGCGIEEAELGESVCCVSM